MVSKLIYAPALLAVAASAALEPQVGQATGTEYQGTARAFAYTDFGVGFAIGGYKTLISYAYDDDCFSTLFNLGFSGLNYHHYYDTGINTSTVLNQVFFGLEMGGLLLDVTSAVGQCAAQKRHAERSQWYENFNLVSDMRLTQAIEEAEEGDAEWEGDLE